MKHLIQILSIALVLIGALLGTNTPARADTIISHTFTFPEAAVSWSNVINLSKINLASGGILNSVQLMVSTSWAVTNQIYNGNVSAADGSYTKTDVEMGLVGSSVLPDQPINLSVFGPTVTVPSHGTYEFYVSTNINYTSPIYSNGTYVLNEFIGDGYIPLSIDMVANATDHTTKNGEFGGLSYEGGGLTMTVVYDYSGTVIVPEPSAGILLGVGGLICWGWRRKVVRKA